MYAARKLWSHVYGSRMQQLQAVVMVHFVRAAAYCTAVRLACCCSAFQLPPLHMMAEHCEL